MKKRIVMLSLVMLFAAAMVFAAGQGGSAGGSASAGDSGSDGETGSDGTSGSDTSNAGTDEGKADVGNTANAGEDSQLQDAGLGEQVREQARTGEQTGEQVREQARLQVRTEEGVQKATLSNGRDAEIKIMPETASETAIARLQMKSCEGCVIELKEVGSGEQTRAAYEVQAQKQSRVLGIFKAQMQVRAEIDAENGEVIMTKKPWWAFLAAE
jgi:hypothetical protein